MLCVIPRELLQWSFGNSMHLSFISTGSERLMGLGKFHLDDYLRKLYTLMSKSGKPSVNFFLNMFMEADSLSENKKRKLEINRYDATDHFTFTLD